jgi:hypothetical protein
MAKYSIVVEQRSNRYRNLVEDTVVESMSFLYHCGYLILLFWPDNGHHKY